MYDQLVHIEFKNPIFQQLNLEDLAHIKQISKDLVLDNIFMRFNIFHAKLAICLTYYQHFPNKPHFMHLNLKFYYKPLVESPWLEMPLEWDFGREK